MKFFYLFIAAVFMIASELKAVSVDSTNIALIVIDTGNLEISDGIKIPATMQIFYKGPNKMNRVTDVPVFDGEIGIDIRGSYSATFPQKSYGFETRDNNGNNLNVSLLGLHAENDWILLANYNDKTFVRAPIAYDAFREMGHWASHSQHCEVIINGQYRGIYTLQEKIKRDKNRLNITEMDATTNSGNSLTGGYIFTHDNNSDGDPTWYSRYGVSFIYVYPKPENITTQQLDYLRQYVNTFETALLGNSFNDPKNGYRKYINVTSFYDYFLIGELSRNVDAYKKSSYWNKDNIADGGLLNAGPVWDFDWSFKNLYDGGDDCFCRNTDGSGWAYRVADCGWGGTPAGWMSRMLEDTTFANGLHHRYFELRNNVLSENRIFAYIDSIQTLLKVPQKRHYKQWPILGSNVGAPELDYIPTTYDGEIAKLKDWISLRLYWLDENMLGKEPWEQTTAMKNLMTSANFRMFPNPCSEILYIESGETISEVTLYGTNGVVLIRETNINALDCQVDVRQLKQNLYLLKIRFLNGEVLNEKIIVQ
jgi:hypothetical protein